MMRRLTKSEWLKQRLAEPFGDACIEWPWATNHFGYGVMYDPNSKRVVKVSRIACEYVNRIPPKGKPFALHSCDNAVCFNPKHLRWGSREENMRDRERRGRTASGDNAGNVKLSDADISKVYSLRNQGLSQRRIGSVLSISQSQVSRILNNKSRNKCNRQSSDGTNP